MRYAPIGEAPCIQRAKIRAFDAWGVLHEALIEWRPLRVFGADDAMENIAQIPVVWMDECPVYFTHVDGGVILIAPRRSVTGSHEMIVTPGRVEDRACGESAPDLDEGCWRLVVRDAKGPGST